MASAVQFFNEQVEFRPPSGAKLKSWIRGVIIAEGKKPGPINFIFCSDEFLLGMNQQYLLHDTLTDIITFNTSGSELIIEGDIFISVDRINDNAHKFKIPFELELHRVMVHGILHLLGYGDKTSSEKKRMREKEDAYLSLRAFTST